MILYRAPWSTNVQRVMMALDHKGLEFDEVVISYEDRSPVVVVSGQPLVPVLVHDGEVMIDSMSIVARLEELFAEPALFPADPARRAQLEVFVDWFERVWKAEPNAIEAGEDVNASAATMDARLDLFDRMLHGQDFLFGGYSAADVCAYPFLKYAARRNPDDDEGFHVILDEYQSIEGRPRLAAWMERIGSQAPWAA